MKRVFVRNRGNSPRRSTGFTLADLIIVVLVMGILATIALGKVTRSYEDSLLVTLQTNLDAIYDALDLNSPGSLPATIEAGWFRSGKLPRHPQAASGPSTLQVSTDAGQTDPSSKVLIGNLAPYWYNSQNGEVRVRVGVVGTQTETLAFYNDVNGTSAVSLGNYPGGGGGGGS